MTRRARSFWILSLFAIGAVPAAAQVTFGVGPVLGYYRPLGGFDPASILSTALPQKPSGLSGTAWGGDAQLSLHRRFGVEALVSTTASTIPGCLCPDGPTSPTQARVSVAIVEGQYALASSPAGYQLWLGAGPGFVQHGGDAYSPYGSPHSWGAAVGLSLVAPLVSHIQAVASTTAVDYAFNLNFPPEHGQQLDVLVHVGLRWRSP